MDASAGSGYSATAETRHARIPAPKTNVTTAAARSRRLPAAVAIGGVAVVGIAAAALFWRPWSSDEQAKPATAASTPSSVPPAPPSTVTATTSPPSAVTESSSSVSPLPAPAVGTPAVSCGVDNDAEPVRAAMASLAGPGMFGEGGLNQAEGNFNPCATLSTVLVYPYGAAGSSAVHALLFHNGRYTGTATPDPYAFMRLNSAQTTDSTVVLDFRLTAGSCNACNDASYVPVKFRWTGAGVEMVGRPPEKYRS